MRAVVIYNPRSGSALPARELKKKVTDAGIKVEAMIDLTKGLEKQLKPWLKRPSVVVIAVGGDGTLGSVATLLIGTKSTFAPLPGGTLNHFTKDLGIPQDMDEAIANLPKGSTHLIDVGSINDTIFLNNSSIGLYPSSLQTRTYFEKRLGKWPAAVIGSLRAFIKFRTYTVSVRDVTFKTPFIFVGNNDYHLGRRDQSRSRLDEGVLCGYAATTQYRWQLLGLMFFALLGMLYEHQDFHRRKAEAFTIRTKHPTLSVSHDGEITRMSTPLEYKIVKKKLRILQ